VVLYGRKTSSVLAKLKGVSDEQVGVNIINKVLSAPIKRLVKNAGLEFAVIIDYLIKQNDKELIYNVEAMNDANAFTAGVIDPAKVVRIAFETAISVAGVLITTESMIVDVPNKDESASSPMGGGGMGIYQNMVNLVARPPIRRCPSYLYECYDVGTSYF
jgi:chaperonin GroEL